jgi:hypothetical protein
MLCFPLNYLFGPRPPKKPVPMHLTLLYYSFATAEALYIIFNRTQHYPRWMLTQQRLECPR